MKLKVKSVFNKRNLFVLLIAATLIWLLGGLFGGGDGESPRQPGSGPSAPAQVEGTPAPTNTPRPTRVPPTATAVPYPNECEMIRTSSEGARQVSVGTKAKSGMSGNTAAYWTLPDEGRFDVVVYHIVGDIEHRSRFHGTIEGGTLSGHLVWGSESHTEWYDFDVEMTATASGWTGTWSYQGQEGNLRVTCQ